MKYMITLLICAYALLGIIGFASSVFAEDLCDPGITSRANETQFCKDKATSGPATSTSNSLIGSGGIVNKVISILSMVAGVASVIVVIIGSLMIIVSGGDSARVKRGRDAILYGIIGLVIAIFARSIVELVLNRLYGASVMIMADILKLNPMNKLIITGLALLVGVLIFMLTTSLPAYAVDTSSACSGVEATGGPCSGGESEVNGIIKTVVNILSYIVGAVSIVMIIIGGLRYVISAGDSSAVTSAKNTILYAIVGLVIAILAQAIVAFVVSRVAPPPTPPTGLLPNNRVIATINALD